MKRHVWSFNLEGRGRNKMRGVVGKCGRRDKLSSAKD
jgi:hypothetical protein